jgi:hypothetical protein
MDWIGIGNWVFGRLGLGSGVKDWDWDLGIGFFEGLGSSSTPYVAPPHSTSRPLPSTSSTALLPIGRHDTVVSRCACHGFCFLLPNIRSKKKKFSF